MDLGAVRAESGAGAEKFVLDGIGAGHRDDFYDVKEQRILGIEPRYLGGYKYPVELLRSRSKEHRGLFARAVVAYLGQELETVRLNEVAARYGRDPS